MNIHEAKSQLKQWAEQIGHGANPFRDVLAAVNAEIQTMRQRIQWRNKVLREMQKLLAHERGLAVSRAKKIAELESQNASGDARRDGHANPH